MSNPFVFESPTPYDETRIHAAAVYCSDGRVGEQIDEFLHRGLGYPRYDRVAVPGGPVCLAGHLLAYWEARGVEEQLRFLVSVHGLDEVVLLAHAGCAYYLERLRLPQAELERAQRADLERAARAVRRLGEGLAVRAFFARRVGDRVRFEAVPL